eukprot:426794-Pleurochrysis_carterae.AAC.1
MDQAERAVLGQCQRVSEPLVPQIPVVVPPASRAGGWAARLAAVFIRDGLARRDVPAVHRTGLLLVETGAARVPQEGAVHCERSGTNRVEDECSDRHLLLQRQGCCRGLL